jgi:hypothetical protein
MATHPTDGLLRAVTDTERRTFAKDGVALLKGLVPTSWIDYLTQAVVRLMDRADTTSQNYTPKGEPRFFSQAFPRFVDPAL